MSNSILAVLLCLVAFQVACASKYSPNVNDKLYSLLSKGDFTSFALELNKGHFEINQPDSAGRIAVIEAVQQNKPVFLDVLLQHQAEVNVHDPVTGETPLQIAFRKNYVAIARTLLAYGASPDLPDKEYHTARAFVPSDKIQDLLSLYDKKGSIAFEDAPGTWSRHVDPVETSAEADAASFFFNVATKETRWNTPPSCGWRREEAADGGDDQYLNLVTKQRIGYFPPALAWTKIRAAGKSPFFYNWIANVTRVEAPAELSEDMLLKLDTRVNRYWFNERTSEHSWVDPAEFPRWRKHVDKESGRAFFVDQETGDSTWKVPIDLAWEQSTSAEGKPFFFNSVTGEAQWSIPNDWTQINKEEL